MISHTDKLAGFFKAVEVMINNNTIKEGRDFAISQPGKLTLKLSGNEKEVRQLSPASMKVLFLRISNVFTMYNQSSLETRTRHNQQSSKTCDLTPRISVS